SPTRSWACSASTGRTRARRRCASWDTERRRSWRACGARWTGCAGPPERGAAARGGRTTSDERAMSLTAGELQRKGVHIGVGRSALLLGWLDWRGAALLAVSAFLFNWQLLPRLGGRALWRDVDHGAGYPIGILLYPLSVLGLVLALRHDLWMVAAVW